ALACTPLRRAAPELDTGGAVLPDSERPRARGRRLRDHVAHSPRGALIRMCPRRYRCAAAQRVRPVGYWCTGRNRSLEAAERAGFEPANEETPRYAISSRAP